MRKRRDYKEGFAQRFGRHFPVPRSAPGVRRVWLQAVSVGEMLAIAPLLEALKRDPSVEVYLTTTTSTGHRLAKDHYAGLTVFIGYFPVDFWKFSRRTWKVVKPDLVILTEGERWPEHMRQAAKRGVPVICINARMSDRSFRRMKRFKPAAWLMLKDITRVLPSSSYDAARFRELGVPVEKITVTGNIKFDVVIPALGEAERAQLRRELGLGEGLVLVGASTWPGEERSLVGALQAARARGVACSLLVVPRHGERRVELERELRGKGLTTHLRSKGAAPRAVDIVIGDTTGELRRLLQLADVVFIGKSLPPHGEGQTPVEAAALRRPILFGPGMTNFREIAAQLLAAGAAVQVADAGTLATASAVLLSDAPRRETLATAAQEWWRGNLGAMERTLAVVREELAKIKPGV